ncbi:MAG TPA: beta-ketoacyl synthase N-terminal-like domain-containing protein [Desulfobacteraceae bacterium]|nr:beta-ketoacyl synthase N-terminal-like domain-containing protein [Desulfobacteraceae bacterium]
MRIAVHGIGLVSGLDTRHSDVGSIFDQDSPGFPPGEPIPGNCRNKYVYRSDSSNLARYVSKKRLRRVDHYSRMALLGAGRALEDAGQNQFSRDTTGVIVASGHGALKTTFAFLDSYIEKGDKLSVPIHFSNSLHNAAASYISMIYGITGPCLTVSQFDMSFFSALITASVWIRQGVVASVLVGCTDEFSDVTGYCIHRFSEEKGGNRDKGYSAGEGAAFFLLTGEGEPDGAAYGYFDEICMENSSDREIDVPEGSLVIFSSGTFDRCARDRVNGFIEKNGADVFVHDVANFPTDSGFDAAFAIREKQAERLCFVKPAENGGYGKIVFDKN